MEGGKRLYNPRASATIEYHASICEDHPPTACCAGKQVNGEKKTRGKTAGGGAPDAQQLFLLLSKAPIKCAQGNGTFQD